MKENTKAARRPPAAAKVAALLIAVSGAWMLIDAVHRFVFGDYFRIRGQLGPWAEVVSAIGISPMSLAVPFTVIGVVSIGSCLALLLGGRWAWHMGILAAILTLPYCCIGTLIAIVVLILLGLKSTRDELKNIQQ